MVQKHLGKLVRLEIENFKSYGGHQTIGPFKNFQAIIGPNGAGELIHRKEGETEIPTKRKCFVKLVFSTSEDEEIHFQRSIVHSASTFSAKHTINNKEVTYAEYDRRLRDLGLIAKATNFLVFQGGVEAIASKSPKELTALVEMVAGSDELRGRYEELYQSKEDMAETTFYNYQKKKGINAERKQYKAQKEEAEAYQKTAKMRDDYVAEHVLWLLFHIERDLKKHAKQRAEKTKQLEELLEKQNLIDRQIADKKSKQAEAFNKRRAVDRKIQKRLKEFEKTRPDAIKSGEEIGHIQKRLEQNRKALKKLTDEYEKHQRDVQMLQSELDEVQREYEAFEEEVRSATRAISFSDEQLAEYNEKKEEVYRMTTDAQQRLQGALRSLTQDKETRESLNNKISELNIRKEQLDLSFAQLEERREKLRDFVAQNNEKLTHSQNQLAELQESNRVASERQEELKRLLEDIAERLQEAKVDLKESERDNRFKEALQDLKRIFPGVLGRVSDLVDIPKKKYSLAVTVAMGSNMDSIVVDTEKTAMECLVYLRDQRVGTATFLPLDKLKSKPVSEKLRLMGDNIKPIIDVLKFEERITPAVLYCVGDTLVVDTLAEARQVAYGPGRQKVVSVDGTLISRAGLMTGGVSGSITARAQRWDEKQVEELKRNRERFFKELSEVGRTLRGVAQEQQLQSVIQGLETGIKFAQKDLTITAEKLTANREDKSSADNELKKLQPVLKKLNKSIEAQEAAVEKIRGEISTTEDSVFASFCAAVGVSNIREYEEVQLKEVKERTERRVKLSTRQAKIQTHLEYERQRDLQGPKERLEASVREDETRLEEVKQLEQKSKQLDSKTMQDVEKLKAEEETHANVVEELESEIKELKKVNSQNVNEVRNMKKQITAQETQSEQLKDQRHNLMRRVQVEEISLPLKEGEEEGEEGNLSQPEEGGDTMDVDVGASQALREAYRKEEETLKTIDFSAIKEKRKAKSQKEYLKYNEKYLKKIQELTLELEKISPNLKAIEQYEGVAERYSATSKEFETSRDKAKDVSDSFEAVKAERRDLFLAAFNEISESIDKIYKEITQNVGSRAYLTLENPDEPFLAGIKYNAIPPKKGFRDMEQLSGGEQTVAALALLFAIHNFKPSPFFVLDEIDAALDPQNVQKVSHYIRHRSKEIQFLVISLKDQFFSTADALVGIYKDVASQCSQTLTLDLSKFPMAAEQALE